MHFNIAKALLLTLVLITFSFSLSGQNKKAIKALQNARLELRDEHYDEAWKQIERALKYDEYYIDALVMAGDFKMYKDQPESAISYYNRAIAVKQSGYIKYKCALAYRDNLQYKEAAAYLRDFKKEARLNERRMANLELLIESMDFGAEAVLNKVPFEPVDLGGGINTDAMQYFPSINAQGDVLVFTSRETEGPKQDEDFFASVYEDGVWQKAERLDGFLNTSDNEGAQSLSADGTELYFAGCQRMDGFGSCDIYVSYYRNGLWSKPVNLGTGVNSANWDSQPSIAPDGKTIYFVRGKAGVTTNTTIMQATRNPDGTWAKAKPIEGLVNTPYADESPFIHFDNETLYFTSDGHPGMGGKDLFYSKKRADGTWGEPINLGYPINTPKDEFSLVVGPNGSTGYFASDRIKGDFILDIFSFELPPEKQATPIAWVLGRVIDAETNKPIDTEVELVDFEASKAYVTLETKPNGTFFAVMPVDRTFSLYINQEGYLPHSENYDLSGIDLDRNYKLTVRLQKIKKGTAFTLKNILFDTDSYALKEASYVELDRLVAFLKVNPSLKAEIQGHTDNIGEASYNKTLSKNRAQAVLNYLVNKGISKQRLTASGFGDTMPITSNETERGRKQNRRTDVILL